MIKDLVCGKYLRQTNEELAYEQKGKTYYFCSTTCKQEFEKRSAIYASHQIASPHGHFVEAGKIDLPQL